MTYKRLTRWCKAAGLQLEQWFPSYHYEFIKRQVGRTLNLGSLGLLRDFVMFEVQGRFRRV